MAAMRRSPLHRNAEWFVLEERRFGPEDSVGDTLLQSIRDCDGLVHLDTPFSRESFWVGFERNHAAKQGKPVWSYNPARRFYKFRKDARAPVDPIVSVLFNLQVKDDVDLVRDLLFDLADKHKFEFRAGSWHRLDNDSRQMIDSIEGMRRKIEHGGIVIVFLSTASVCAGFHDYADPFGFQRAQRDFISEPGYAASVFAELPAERTMVVWLDQPDEVRIEEALVRFALPLWTPYVQAVRAALTLHRDPKKVPFTATLGVHSLDDILARAFALSLRADPELQNHFRAVLQGKAPEAGGR